MTLGTTYLGLDLAHPVIAGASPLSATLDGIKRLEDAGAAAIVTASLYENHRSSPNRSNSSCFVCESTYTRSALPNGPAQRATERGPSALAATATTGAG